MANAVHISRGAKFLLKGTIFIILGVALFSIFGFAYRRYNTAENPKDGEIENVENIEQRTINRGEITNRIRPERRIDFSDGDKVEFDKSTCYTNLPRPLRLTCLPFYVLVDIEGVNAFIIQNFLRQCRNIMTYEPPQTSFFIKYPNMDDVNRRQLNEYLIQFRQFSRRILRRGGDLIYGDMGQFGPRPYVIDPNADVAVPYFTPLRLLRQINRAIKVIYPLRNPTIATFVAYCAADYPIDEFEAEVDKGLALFNACKLQEGFVPCEFKPEMHDTNNLKVRVVNHIHSFWIRMMTQVVPMRQYHFVLYEDLVRPGSQVKTLKDILHFLTFKEITDEDIEEKIRKGNEGGSEGGQGSGVPVPPKCDISKIPTEAKKKLDIFFEPYNLILKEEFEDRYFNGWSYPIVRR